ncbi:tetratricopeptide repeat protein [Rhizobium sp. RCAM05350]|nr:tetratricopeptide repeat protein [Rhizobium sp. RCAM05350]
MIVVLGDSHMRAIVNGYATFSAQEQAEVSERLDGFQCGMIGPAFSFSEPFWTQTDRGVVFTSENMQQLFRAIVGEGNDVIRPSDEREFIFSIGSQPSLLHVEGLWNGHTAGRHVEGVTHLSRSGFRAMLLHYNRYVFGLFKTLQTLNVKFSVMAGPPPSLQFAFLVQKRERGLDLWRFHEEIFSQELGRMGVPIEYPPATVRERNAPNGFLRLALCDSLVANSPHGNKDYGEIFIRSMLRQRGVGLMIEENGDRYDSRDVLRDWYCKLGFAMANKRVASGKAKFALALKIDPHHKESMFGLGYMHERLSHTAEAAKQYKETLTKHPRYADCWAALGALKIASNEMDEAKTAIAKAIELDPSRVDWHLRLGVVLEKLNEKDEASRVLREALFEADSDVVGNVELHLKEDPLGIAHIESPFPTEHDPYEAATFPIRSSAPYLVILGRAEMTSDPSFAERCFKLALDIDDRPEWRSYLGDIYFERGEWTFAAENYQPASEKFPKNPRFAERLRMSLENQYQSNY